MGLASLAMYDLPEARAAVDAFWAGLAGHLRREGVADVPHRLTHDMPVAALLGDPRLMFGQCCGADLFGPHARSLRVVATPHFHAPGCTGADHSSVVVVAADSPAATLADLRGSVCAVNEPGSHSGATALRALVARDAGGGRFFSRVVLTGSHAASLDRVRDGTAAVAAIDCVTWALLARHRPAALEGLRILVRTESAPGLPYVTHAGIDTQALRRLRAAVIAAFADPTLADARDALLLEDVEVLPDSAYDRIAELAALADRHRLPLLE